MIKLSHRLISLFNASQLRKRYASNSLWTILATFGFRGSAILSTIILARIVGRTILGELGILTSTLGLFSVVAGFGMNIATAKFVSQFRATQPKRAGSMISLAMLTVFAASLFFATIMILLKSPLASSFMQAPHLANLLAVMSLLLIFQSLSGVQTGILMGLEAFKTVSRLNLILGVLYLLLTVGGAYFYKLKGIVFAISIHGGISFFLQHIYVAREMKKHLIFFTLPTVRNDFLMLWNFGFPVFLGSIAIIPVTWVCNILLVNQANGYAEMGAFSVGLQWFNMITLIPNLLKQSVFPILNERLGAGDKSSVKQIWHLSMVVVTTIAVVLCVSGALFAKLILALYGTEFITYAAMLRLMLVCGAMQAILDSVVHILMVQNRMWVLFVMNFGFATVCLVVSMLLISWGAAGLATGRLAAYVLHSIWIIAFISCSQKQNYGSENETL